MRVRRPHADRSANTERAGCGRLARMPNRLIDEQSSYLLQHAGNPIDWWGWCDEAFAEAKASNRPVLLSVGYASCHWCHVMAHESFTDPVVAQFVNDHFVAIKVDRQERPDVDAAYMRATQALSGAGGWPMTCFLTPDGLPFFAGTYFPPQARAGMPSFMQVCQAMAEAWGSRGDEVLASAEAIASQLTSEAPRDVSKVDVWKLVDRIGDDFDLIHGGWGGAPKFPAATLIDALLVKGDKHSLDMAQLTLEAMARGGIYDQVGGGFHRYAVDAGWVVPHFEKMLYDNGLLLGTYVRGWRRTADHDEAKRALFERAAYGIVDFLVRELRTEDGAFMAGLDADSCDIRGAVHEGIFYLWNDELLTDALGADDADWASQVFHVTKAGTFEDGLSTLQLRGVIDHARLDDVAATLLVERANRFRPATDELVVAAWNGWTISSLLWGAMVFGERGWLDLAESAASYLWRVHWDGERLARTSHAGVAGAPGVADDYGAVASAFALLAGVRGDATWLRRAEALCEAALGLFGAEDGGFYDSAAGLFDRGRALTEASTPSGTSTLVEALRLVGAMADRPELAERAEEAAVTQRHATADAPRLAGAALADLFVADEARRGLGRAVAVVVTDDPLSDLARAAWRLAPAGTAIIAGPPGTTGFAHHFDGRLEPAAYVCRGVTCFEPVSDYADLKDPLWRRA